MKLRLMGSPDLIDTCAGLLVRAGLSAQKYPCRQSNERRLYCDIDDRDMAALLRRAAAASTGPTPEIPAPTTARPARSSGNGPKRKSSK